MMLHHHPAVAIVAIVAIVAAFVLPFLTPPSRIGLAVVAAVLCAGLPLVAELGVIFGASVVTAACNRAREARRVEQQAAAAKQSGASDLAEEGLRVLRRPAPSRRQPTTGSD